MKKILFACIFFMFTFCSYGQNNIEISLQQDVRLFFFGDQIGNDPLTVNFLSKIEIPIYNLKKNHFSTYISVEYADIVGKDYKRYALGVGYVIRSIYGKIGAIAYVDFGKTYRQKVGCPTYSFSGELNYKINNRLKFIVTQQFTQRKDLEVVYNSKNEYRFSSFVGLKFRM